MLKHKQTSYLKVKFKSKYSFFAPKTSINKNLHHKNNFNFFVGTRLYKGLLKKRK